MPRPHTRAAMLTTALLCAAVPASAHTLEVGPGKPFAKPSDAINTLQDGDTVQIAAGEYFDCGVVRASNVTIEGTGPGATAVLTDKTCAGKGLLVTAGSNITIRNLTLTRARVPDGNGAGIRAEGAGLVVEGVKFINNENGILGGAEGATMTIRNSDFTRNGSCSSSGGCAHGIYALHLGLLHVEGSSFTETRQGHHIKSRAVRTEVIGCTITDGQTGTASYAIDIPNGGDLVARNNTITKGPKSENRTGAIVIGAEGVSQRTGQIAVEGNTFRAEGGYSTYFVVNFTATEATLIGNKISGSAQPLRGDGTVK